MCDLVCIHTQAYPKVIKNTDQFISDICAAKGIDVEFVPVIEKYLHNVFNVSWDNIKSLANNTTLSPHVLDQLALVLSERYGKLLAEAFVLNPQMWVFASLYYNKSFMSKLICTSVYLVRAMSLCKISGFSRYQLPETLCSICMGDKEDHAWFQLNCSHSFHENCIRQWMHVQNSCPACRAVQQM
jgi:hypothetical protein